MKQAILDHLTALGPQTIGDLAYDLQSEVFDIRSDLRILHQQGLVTVADGVWSVRND